MANVNTLHFTTICYHHVVRELPRTVCKQLAYFVISSFFLLWYEPTERLFKYQNYYLVSNLAHSDSRVT